MPLYGYNYPWSGRLGRIADCCPWCGTKGMSFQISSSSHCLSEDCPRRKGADPIPEIIERQRAKADRLARKWCKDRGIDHDATVKNYLDYLGPKLQERDEPIPGAEKDYTVWIDPAKQMTDKEFLAKKGEILKLMRHLTNMDWWTDHKKWEWYEWDAVYKKASEILEGDKK